MNFAKVTIDQSLSVVVPAYNDEQTVEVLIRDGIAVLEEMGCDFEIFVINDGSSDRTGKVLEDLSKADSRIRVQHHPQNKGYGVTLRDLYKGAKKELIFSAPGDGQIPIGEILKLLPEILSNDIVIGRRVDRKDNWKRYIQTKIYNFLIRRIFGLTTRDINSVKLIKRRVFDEITLETESPFVEAELCIKAAYKGFKIFEKRIEHKRRVSSGASGGSFKIIYPTFVDLVRMAPRLRRLKT
ncbi:MAG: glycosyltransferase family 2 protein [Candidatus Omnitrophica bacterium]|nr:glycosyltransferase family 2 protein [Candidatus Omnitrophota bacterium]